MLVIDASVLVNALLDDGRAGSHARAAIAADDHWAAPGHLHIEVLSVIRGRLIGRKIARGRAEDAVAALDELAIDIVGPARLVARIWQLRGNATAYDAAYIAAAELLDCPLLTADCRLARSPGPRCEIRAIDGN